MTAHEVCRKLQQIYKLEYQIFCPNGKEAGQTVNHLHLHLIPLAQPAGLERKDDKVRPEEDMTREADRYRSCFQQAIAP